MSKQSRCRGVSLSGKKCTKLVKKENGFCHYHLNQAHARDDKECAICMEPVGPPNVLSCGHMIHFACLAKHNKLECPVCRVPPTGLPKKVVESITKNQQQTRDEEEDMTLESFDGMLELMTRVVEDMTRQILFSGPLITDCDCQICQENPNTRVYNSYILGSNVPIVVHDMLPPDHTLSSFNSVPPRSSSSTPEIGATAS